MKRVLLTAGCLVLSLGLWATSAQAVSFNFEGNGGNEPFYNFNEGGIGVTVTGFSTGLPRFVNQSPLGLGVFINGDGSANGGAGQVDGSGPNETLRFAFNQQVILETVTFSEVGSNDDALIRIDGGFFASGDIPGTGNNQLANFVPGFSELSRTGTVFDFTVLGNNDDYRVRAMSVSAANDVPEPGTAILFGSGMAGLGLWNWRRAKATKSDQE